MARYDALWPLHRAIVRALATSTDVAAALPTLVGTPPRLPIYSGAADATAPLPRIVLGFTTGGLFDTFGERGAQPTVQVDGFTTGSDLQSPCALGAAICGALDDDALLSPLFAPAGGWPGGITIDVQNVTCELVSILPDPTPNAMHVVCRFSCHLVPR